jgi:hypothetical protein
MIIIILFFLNKICYTIIKKERGTYYEMGFNLFI